MPKKILKGIVVSDKMQKTIVVKVETIKKHSKLQKRHKTHKKYKAHDAKEFYKIGDRITIRESRPISKHKRWQAIYPEAKDIKSEAKI